MRAWCRRMPLPLGAAHAGASLVPPKMCSRRLRRSAGANCAEPYCGACPRRSGVIQVCAGKN